MTSVDTNPVERRIEEEGEEMMDDDEEEEEEEGEDDDDDVEEEEEEEEGDHSEVTVGRRSGRGLTLKTLLKERVLEPGEDSMTINYLGNKFKGDLLPDGRIRSQETNKIFGTPSAWAIYCKKIVNPDKKSGCGWASVRYRGKKLDSYKNNWYRQKRLEYEKEEEEMEEEESESESEEISPPEQEIIEFEVLGNRDPSHESSTMVELGTFQAIGRMQPFNITMSSSATAVIDVHSHLTTSEVVGYLAGQWDVNNHNLIVSHAFPLRCRLGDSEKGLIVEQELYAEMARLKLSLVGWYHTHPTSPPLPSIRDIDSQLDYEMKMKGYNDASYTPVLGIIISPYQKSPVHDRGIPHPNGNATGFWVMPPPENKPLEYGRPMSMQFTVVQDAFIPKEALLHMSEVVKYYKDCPDSIELTDIFENKYTYWHKLKSSLRGRVPKDHYQPLIEFLTKVIDKKLPEDDPIPPPPPAAPVTTAPSTSSSVIISTTASISAPNLPPSTSISVVESKKSVIDHPSSTKELESCVANIIKGTLGSDISSSVTLADILSKDRESSVIISPSFNSIGSEKYSDEHSPISSRPKSVEGKTPPPKSYSPLFQLPMPPLFSLDAKPVKETQHLKASYQPLNLQLEDKKHGEFSSPKSRSPLTKVEKQHPNGGTSGEAAGSSSKYDIPSSSGFLDLSKDRKTVVEDSKKEKESKLGLMDVPAWFAQAKLMQEAFALPPHERENPFARSSSPATHRDIPPLFPSEFLAPHWNPSLAKAGFHTSLSFNSDSKPTYHSDVPLLLKKQQEESLKESKLSHIGHEAKDFIKKNIEEHFLHREFRMPPPEYKEPKEKDSRESRETLNKSKERDQPREMRAPYEPREREFKEPKLFNPKEIRSETSKEVKDKLSHSIRDIQELARRELSLKKDPYFDRLEHGPREFKEPKETKDSRDIRDDKLAKSFDPKELMREARSALENRDRESRDARETKEQREPKEYRELMEARDLREQRDVRESERSENISKEEVRDVRKTYDASEVKSDFRESDREISLNLIESGSAKGGEFRGVTPMDMTFKIKRDILNPDGRHFIEPSGMKRVISESQNISISETSRNFLDPRDPILARSAKDTVISLASSKEVFDSPVSTEFSKERLESTFSHPLSRGSEVKDNKNFEQRESSDHKESVPKAVINLRDPKTLYEKRDYREAKEKPEDLQMDRVFPQPQRRLFPPLGDMEGSENPPTTSSVYIPHTLSAEEPMEFE